MAPSHSRMRIRTWNLTPSRRSREKVASTPGSHAVLLGLWSLLLLGLLLQCGQPPLSLLLLGLHFFPGPHPFAHVNATFTISLSMVVGGLVPGTFKNPGFLLPAGPFLRGQGPRGFLLFCSKLISGAGSKHPPYHNEQSQQKITQPSGLHRTIH